MLFAGRRKRGLAQEDVLEEIALTPEANPLQTPFSAMRPHASLLRPILVRGSPRFGQSDAGSTGGSPQDLQLSWSSLGQEGSSLSRQGCWLPCTAALILRRGRWHGRVWDAAMCVLAIPTCCNMAARLLWPVHMVQFRSTLHRDCVPTILVCPHVRRPCGRHAKTLQCGWFAAPWDWCLK